MRLNPNLVATAAPPIPEVKAWAAAYDGSQGPLIDLSQAVPGYPPHPELLRRSGLAAAGRDAAAYGDIAGDAALRDTYAAHLGDLYAGRIKADNVAITAGCNLAFHSAMIALAAAGDAVVLPSPWYFNHKMTLDMLGIAARLLPCRPETGFVPDAADAAALLDDRVRAIVLVTPNNPTGAVYPPTTIRAFQDLCSRSGIALVVDETYRDFIGGGDSPHAGFADPQWPETLIQLYSFSKSYCIPGQRIGAMVAGSGIIAEVMKTLDCAQICAPRAPQIALPWAIAELGEWRATNRHEMAHRAETFRAAMARLDAWTLRSIGAYFAYLEHPYPGESSKAVAERLARENGVVCLPGAYFGPDQDRFLRVAFANVQAAALATLAERIGGKPSQMNGLRQRLAP